MQCNDIDVDRGTGGKRARREGSKIMCSNESIKMDRYDGQ
jgi:hypothetical protein